MTGLEFIDDLVGHLAWPVVVVVVVVIIICNFRVNVAELIDRLRSLKLPGGVESTFDARALAEAGGGLIAADKARAPSTVTREVESIELRTVDGVIADEAKITDSIEAILTPDPEALELERRAQVETVIDQAARWGWEQAIHGSRSDRTRFQQPVVRWTPENEPQILSLRDLLTEWAESQRLVNPGDSVLMPNSHGAKTWIVTEEDIPTRHSKA